jgi:hypothetical protein
MSNVKTIEITVERTIPTAPGDALDAWLNPKVPGTPWNMAEKLLLNPTVDGFFFWAIKGTPHYGRFTILDRPSKVQYTWMSLHTRGLESLVTVKKKKKGEDTLLTLRHENLPDDEYGRGHEKGWGYL